MTLICVRIINQNFSAAMIYTVADLMVGATTKASHKTPFESFYPAPVSYKKREERGYGNISFLKINLVVFGSIIQSQVKESFKDIHMIYKFSIEFGELYLTQYDHHIYTAPLESQSF